MNLKTFRDISSNDIYFNYINELSTKGFISWYEDNTFKPQNPITRTEFLKLLFLIAWVWLSSDIKIIFKILMQIVKKYVNTVVNLKLISTHQEIFPGFFL